LERSLAVLLLLFAFSALASSLTAGAPLFGLSTILSVSVLGSSVLGSSVLGSSVLGSSVLGSTIVEAYAGAVVASQLWLSLVVIALLIYLELSDPSYGRLRKILLELRRSWLPVSGLLVVLFFIIVALKVYAILMG